LLPNDPSWCCATWGSAPRVRTVGQPPVRLLPQASFHKNCLKRQSLQGGARVSRMSSALPTPRAVPFRMAAPPLVLIAACWHPKKSERSCFCPPGGLVGTNVLASEWTCPLSTGWVGSVSVVGDVIFICESLLERARSASFVWFDGRWVNRYIFKSIRLLPGPSILVTSAAKPVTTAGLLATNTLNCARLKRSFAMGVDGLF
jgi:hypothetical protein